MGVCALLGERPFEARLEAMLLFVPGARLLELELGGAAAKREARDLVVEVGALDEAPLEVGIATAHRPGERTGEAPRRARGGELGLATLARVERVSKRRADGLVGLALDARRFGVLDLAQVRVVDVAREEDERGRGVAALARADLAEKLGDEVEGVLERGPVVEVDRAAKLLRALRDSGPPGAVADLLAPHLGVVHPVGEEIRVGGRQQEVVEVPVGLL